MKIHIYIFIIPKSTLEHFQEIQKNTRKSKTLPKPQNGTLKSFIRAFLFFKFNLILMYMYGVARLLSKGYIHI